MRDQMAERIGDERFAQQQLPRTGFAVFHRRGNGSVPAADDAKIVFVDHSVFGFVLNGLGQDPDIGIIKFDTLSNRRAVYIADFQPHVRTLLLKRGYDAGQEGHGRRRDDGKPDGAGGGNSVPPNRIDTS